MNTPPVLVTCATFNYLEMLTLLLASHRASNPQVTLHVHAIDWPEGYLEAARICYPDATFHAQKDPTLAHQQIKELKGPTPRTAGILKLKVELLYSTWHSCTGPVIWVDADTVLLSSLEPLLQYLRGDVDFAVTYRARKRPHARFAVAILCFTRSDASQRLLSRYRIEAASSKGITKRKQKNGAPWFHDQLALWRAYKMLSQGFLGLPRKGRPRLLALSEELHSIDGLVDAMFLSRRDNIMDTAQMRELLVSRDIKISVIDPAPEN